VTSRRGETRLVPIELLRLGICGIVGAGVALGGFAPLNDAADVLDVAAHPERVVLLPPVVVWFVAVVGAAIFGGRSVRSVPLVPLLATTLLMVGGFASLTATGDIRYSTTLLIIGIICPFAIAGSLLTSELPHEPIALSFLVTIALLLIHADGIFVRDYGFPSPSDLFTAKFSSAPHDFHYYTLNNPDHTSLFLILPLTVATFWALKRSLPLPLRLTLVACALVFLVNEVLVYVRVGVALGIAVVLGAVALAPQLRRRIRVTIVLLSLAIVATVARSTAMWTYLQNAASTEGDASGVQRLHSIGSGLRVLWHHPLTGVGLGRYGNAVEPPAHSAVIQAGAELGVCGLVGIGLLFGYFIWRGVDAARARQWNLRTAAVIACGVYALDAGLTAGADLGVLNGYVAIWGMSFGLVAAIGLRGDIQPKPVPTSFEPPG
jgi:O-Antigen ligase